MDGHLIDVKGAEELLRVSKRTIYREIAEGKLAVVKIGDRTLFRPVDIERFIDQSRQQRNLRRDAQR